MDDSPSLYDKTFLRRSCETFSWETAILFCETILLPILQEHKERDMDRSSSHSTSQEFFFNDSVYGGQKQHKRREHKEAHSAAIDQLKSWDEWGNTPLHAACYNKPPLRIVTSILKCASVASLNLHLFLTKDGSTPLNIACATGASTDVLRVLLNPPAPLESGGLTVTIADATGSTPLAELTTHYNLERQNSIHKGARKLHELHFSARKRSSSVFARSRGDGCTSPDELEHNQPLFEQFRIRVFLLLRASWEAVSKRAPSVVGKWTSYLHAMALLSESCPPELAEVLTRSFSHWARVPNENGFLPLHLAIQPPIRVKYRRKLLQRNALELRQSFIIEQLLRMNPQSSRLSFPFSSSHHQKSRRNVLCQAIATGLQWHVSNQGETATPGPLQSLTFSNPQAIALIDDETGLYPFLLAATLTSDTLVDAVQLDTIYELLRCDPSVLVGCFRVQN